MSASTLKNLRSAWILSLLLLAPTALADSASSANEAAAKAAEVAKEAAAKAAEIAKEAQAKAAELAKEAAAKASEANKESAAKAAEIAKQAAAKAAEAAKEAAAKAAEYEKESSSGSSDSSKSTVTKPAGLSGQASSVQSTARPFDLSIAGPVQVGGSDDSSKTFMKGDLAKLTEFVNSKLSEKVPINDSTMLLNPEKLFLKNASDVRVYFVGEGAGFLNSLGYNTDGGGIKTGNPELIFPNASSPVSPLNPNSGSGVKRSDSEPLLPGDFVDLGTVKGGTKLDFFLIADGARKGTTVFSTDQSVNPDAINHVVAFSGLSGSYLLIGFEDLLNGGDRDFNDVLVAVEIGAANLAALTATPEPATLAILPMFLGLGWWMKRRQDAKAPATVA